MVRINTQGMVIMLNEEQNNIADLRIGTVGISFVLGTATAGLEFRQQEKYGDSEEYKQWVKKSWVGFKMGKQKKKDEGENNVDEEETEEA